MGKPHSGPLCASLLLLISTLTLLGGAATAREGMQPQEANEVTRFLERLDVMPPEHYRGLTVFPIELRGSVDETDYASLDEAFRGGIVRVWDTGRVERVAMENVSRSAWVFAMAGEVILGGKQNRMIRDDVLLAPGGGPVEVATYCVEQGRWVGRDDARFEAGKTLSNYALRERALAGAPQAAVWDQVDREQKRFGVASETKDYDAVANSPAVARELSEYRAKFAPIWRSRAVGIVVAQGRSIVSADVFCNTRLFWKLRDKLINSYAFDCVKRYEHRDWGLRQEDARDFMARVYTARFSRYGTPGAGEKLAFGGSGVSGSALAYRGAALHFHVSPGYAVPPVPEPVPGPGLPIRPPVEER